MMSGSSCVARTAIRSLLADEAGRQYCGTQIREAPIANKDGGLRRQLADEDIGNIHGLE